MTAWNVGGHTDPTSETVKPAAARTRVAHTSGGVNCETGWAAAAAWPFLFPRARAEEGRVVIFNRQVGRENTRHFKRAGTMQPGSATGAK